MIDSRYLSVSGRMIGVAETTASGRSDWDLEMNSGCEEAAAKLIGENPFPVRSAYAITCNACLQVATYFHALVRSTRDGFSTFDIEQC